MIDYFEGENSAPTTDLAKLTELVRKSADIERELADLSEQMATKQADLDRILRVYIPDILDQSGLESLKLADGSTVKSVKEIKASISKERADAAHKWLEDNDFGGIIKTNVKVAFGKGELDNAGSLIAELEGHGYNPELERSVHASTLKSFVKERLEAGDNIPVELFGIFEYKIAKITKPRAKR